LFRAEGLKDGLADKLARMAKLIGEVLQPFISYAPETYLDIKQQNILT
jgi:hypothetical protein